MREASLEEKCRKLTEAHDGKLLKFSTKSEKGWHDRLLLMPGGFVALVEFKRGAKAATQPLQNTRHTWCKERHIPSYRVWEYDQFVEAIRSALITQNIVSELFDEPARCDA